MKGVVGSNEVIITAEPTRHFHLMCSLVISQISSFILCEQSPFNCSPLHSFPLTSSFIQRQIPWISLTTWIRNCPAFLCNIPSSSISPWIAALPNSFTTQINDSFITSSFVLLTLEIMSSSFIIFICLFLRSSFVGGWNSLISLFLTFFSRGCFCVF